MATKEQIFCTNRGNCGQIKLCNNGSEIRKKGRENVHRESTYQLDCFRNVHHNTDLMGAQLTVSLFQKPSSIPCYSGWWQRSQCLAKKTKYTQTPKPAEAKKKGWTPVSCISDKLGFVQFSGYGFSLCTTLEDEVWIFLEMEKIANLRSVFRTGN